MRTVLALLALAPALVATRGPAAQERKAPASRPAAKPQGKPAKPQDKPAKPQDKPAKPQDKPSRAVPDMDDLLAPYLTEGLLGRLEIAPAIRTIPEDELANLALPKLTGERNRLILAVGNLVDGLGDVRYTVREQSETALVNLGPVILPILKSIKTPPDLEVAIRLDRVIRTLDKAGRDDIVRKALIARGLAEALEYRPGKVEARALLSALDSLDARVRIAAIRSLGTMLEDPELGRTFEKKVFDRIRRDVDRQDLGLRNAVTATLGGMPTDRAERFLAGIAGDEKRPASHRLLALRLLAARLDRTRLAGLAADLGGPASALARSAAEFYARRAPDEAAAAAPAVLLELKDGGKLETTLLGMDGDKVLFAPSKEFAGLATLRIPRGAIDEIRAVARPEAARPGGVFLLLKTGTRLAVRDLAFDGRRVTAVALGRKVTLPRSSLRGILPDPEHGRALGGSRQADQVRLREGKEKVVKGTVAKLNDAGVTILDETNRKRTLAWEDVESVLFQLDFGSATGQDAGDINQYVQVDLATGERVVGFLLGLGSRGIALASKQLGCFELPLRDIATMKLSNSGRALTGFTLVTDYGNTRVVEYDGEGREVWKLEDLFDPLDAELTPSGSILVTEQGDNAVREYDRDGSVLWEFTRLTRPLDADRLPNGNTLITDPGNFRVIEVDPKGRIVWTFGRKEAKNAQFKPYDADRLPNGNTLIADYGGEQVIEITPAGKVAWSFRGTRYVCDTDRLPSGNTLITMRQPPRVIEVTPAHVTVWKLLGLQLPWDADRLPDGTTMVAENYGVRIYSKEGKPLKKLDAEWASEANGY